VRAIVVDDSRAMRGILKRVLKVMNFDVTEACDGKAALDALLVSGPIDLGLIDWNMPNMNGLELIRILRANPVFDAMRLVMVTTEVEMNHIAIAMEAGANEYMMKPFTEQMAVEKLEMMGFNRAAA
jgi:two-component system, chemotaxis family, chemotaxis protein CheY